MGITSGLVKLVAGAAGVAVLAGVVGSCAFDAGKKYQTIAAKPETKDATKEMVRGYSDKLVDVYRQKRDGCKETAFRWYGAAKEKIAEEYNDLQKRAEEKKAENVENKPQGGN
ncbi:hypothetical protein KY311_02795 [Candidatus Woesearchaeota archaeon]|nr:hypothetical protein [Candidatus Woesearchaeota archaeon]MBW3016811.1 hypothetical protein [Candidatus Woesearchaeota archaeon]